MQFLVVGLGNPGEEYKNSRHNTGWMMVDVLAGKEDWKTSSDGSVEYTWIKLDRHKIELVKPLKFMNKSGPAILPATRKHKVKPENIVVIHDDIDIPVGSIKISFGRGSGGHRGVESVKRALKTKDFVRIRVGVVPTTPTGPGRAGKLKKPKGESKVLDFLLGDFTSREKLVIKKLGGKVAEAVETIVTEGREKAMSLYN